MFRISRQRYLRRLQPKYCNPIIINSLHLIGKQPIVSLSIGKESILKYENIICKAHNKCSMRYYNQLAVDNDSMAHLAAGGVICRNNGTVVHIAVTYNAKYDATDGNFLPLTVDYRSRSYSYGILPETRTKRERPGDNEILVARIIDRAVRPLFTKGYVDDVQITATLHSCDNINDPVATAVNATSMALMKSKLPWSGPIGCVRIGFVNGELLVDPSTSAMETSSLDLLYVGTKENCIMIEVSADELSEDIILQAFNLAQHTVAEIILKQQNLVGNVTSTPEETIVNFLVHAVPPELTDFLEKNKLNDAVNMFQSSRALPRKLRSKLEGKWNFELSKFIKEDPVWKSVPLPVLTMAVHDLMTKAFRLSTLTATDNDSDKRRVDGRRLDEIRPLSMSVSVLPNNVHGSAVFKRGETHVLSTVTIGSLDDCVEDVVHGRNPFPSDLESVDPSSIANSRLTSLNIDNFLLHYDFPAYSTGELGMSSVINRRMVGHGKLAEKALRTLIPPPREFPYAIRVFCECTSSNGSSSMASVCGGSLALMDAGVPIKRPAAGISIGLMTWNNNETNTTRREYTILTDIIGQEDHYGDMDFKVAGTVRGITAMQLDSKLSEGVPVSVLADALGKARTGILRILSEMTQAMPTARISMKQTAPRGDLIEFPVERKRFLIGPGGEMIKYIRQTYNVSVELIDPSVPSTSESASESVESDSSRSGQETCFVYIFGQNHEGVAEAKQLIVDLVSMVEEGQVFTSQVIDVKDYGLIVKLTRSQEALLHVSELSWDPAVTRGVLSDLFCVGQRIDVKVLAVDKATGVIKVSRKVLLDKLSSIPDQSVLRRQVYLRSSPSTQVSDDSSGLQADEAMGALKPIGSLPEFPVIPPRAYNANYFRINTATEEDVKKALNKLKTGSNQSKLSQSSTEGTSSGNIGRHPAPPHRRPHVVDPSRHSSHVKGKYSKTHPSSQHSGSHAIHRSRDRYPSRSDERSVPVSGSSGSDVTTSEETPEQQR